MRFNIDTLMNEVDKQLNIKIDRKEFKKVMDKYLKIGKIFYFNSLFWEKKDGYIIELHMLFTNGECWIEEYSIPKNKTNFH